MAPSFMTISRGEDVENALAAEAMGDPGLQRRGPRLGNLERGSTGDPPAVVGYGDDAHVARHGVNNVGQRRLFQQVVAVYARPGRHPSPALGVVPCRYDAGHGCAVVVDRVERLTHPGIVEAESLDHIVAQVFVVTLQFPIDHCDVDAFAFVRGPHVRNVDVQSPSLRADQSDPGTPTAGRRRQSRCPCNQR